MISTSGAFLATAWSMIALQRTIDWLAAVVDVVQIEFQLHRATVRPQFSAARSTASQLPVELRGEYGRPPSSDEGSGKRRGDPGGVTGVARAGSSTGQIA